MQACIVINAVTHRSACLDGLGAADVAAYDDAIGAFFERLTKAAHAEGYALEVDQHGQGSASYRIEAAKGTYGDLLPSEIDAVHEFMQSSAADFWAQY